MVTPEQIDKAQREAVHPAAAPAAELLERLAEKLGGRLTQSAVYGEPIECDGVTIITVARVSWGFGGAVGAGGDPRNDDLAASGGGGGGGVSGVPLGYLEIKDGNVEFKPIREPLVTAMIPLVMLAAGVSAPRIARTLRRLIRRETMIT